MITDGLRRSKDNDFREAVFYAVSPGPYGENGSFLLLFYLPWKQEKIKTYHGYREFISFWQPESLWHNR